MTLEPAAGVRERLVRVVLHLSEHPRQLLLALLALNALTMPYANWVHDARFYGFQVLNRLEDGRYHGDLFFEHGSQDRFSLFSPALAPLARVFGLPLCFFLLYLAWNVLFLLALQRLVFALVPDRLAATLGLLLLAIAPVPYGGHSIFTVNENFLTPRLLSCTLVLFALERLLRGHLLVALGLLLPALAFHPLMALGGVMFWLGWWVTGTLRPRWLLGLGVLLAGAAATVLLYEPLGLRLFGLLDPKWRDCIHAVTIYNFTAEWTKEDWLRILVAVGVTLGAWSYLPRHSRERRFLVLLVVVGLLGLLGTVLAGVLPYALLLQGQPYRALWPLQLLYIPLALLLVVRWRQHGETVAHAAAAVLLGYLVVASCLTAHLFLLFVVLTWPVLALFWHGLSTTPRRADWLARSAGVAVLLSLAGWLSFKVVLVALNWDAAAAFQNPVLTSRVVYWMIEPVHRLLLAGLLLALLYRFLHSAAFAGTTGVVALTLQLFAFVAPQIAAYAGETRADIAWVRARLTERGHDPAKPPTIYWSLGRVEYVWFDLRVNSFYTTDQFVGSLFSRPTALEGDRRARLVRPFEVERFFREALLDIFKEDVEPLQPTVEHLHALAQETKLDYIIIPLEFEGLAAASNGRWFFYDCKDLRRHDPRPARQNAREL